MKFSILFFLLLIAVNSNLSANNFNTDTRVRKYITPKRIVWTQNDEHISNKNILLKDGVGQATLNNENICTIISSKNIKPAILLDFGKEIQGGVQIVTGRPKDNKPIKIRIRFGESVSETMCDIDGKNGASNDHAIRDFETLIPWLGTTLIGNTGFRFVRIDLTDPDRELQIKAIRGVSTFRDIEYKGAFQCNDEKLNNIWQTGAYTVHLNMQEYLWDGIKRDRLVWVGDMHPEIMTINYVFGYNDVVPRSLDMIKENTPLPLWMNNISSYSMWWVLTQRDWFYFTGDKKYLQKQKPYLTSLLIQLSEQINEDGMENFKGRRFMDWTSSENEAALHGGLHSLLMLTMKAGIELSEVLEDEATKTICETTYNKMLKAGEKVKENFLREFVSPIIPGTKQGASLMVMSGIANAKTFNTDILSQNGSKGFSTFYGYYILQAMAKAGDIGGALNMIREYWGGMLDVGATTFWEDFDIDWLENAGRIDELIPDGKKDIHKDYGNYCYKGYRHSLCHGWASGPTPWLSRYVLGIEVLEPGCKTVKISPNLGDLEWAKGSFPTPYGKIYVYHKKDKNGNIITEIDAPSEIKIIK